MKLSWRKKSRWDRMVEPIAGKVKGRSLELNGKALTAQGMAKPAARAVGGLVIATTISAIISTFRGQTNE
jgi:hypothetical protein